MRIKRKLLLLLAVILIACYLCIPGIILPRIVNTAVDSARAKGVFLTMSEPYLDWNGFSAKFIELGFKNFPNPIIVSAFDVEFSLFDILRGSKLGRMRFEVGGGRADFSFAPSSNSSYSGKGSIEQIQLERLPFVSSMGFKGLLSYTEVELVADQNFNLESTKGHLIISKLFRSKAPLDLALFALPFSQDLPELSADQLLAVDLEFTPQQLFFAPLSASSSWFEITTDGHTIIPFKSSAPLRVKGEVYLTDDGTKAIGDYLPLLSYQKLEASTDAFKFLGRGRKSRPIYSFEAL